MELELRSSDTVCPKLLYPEIDFLLECQTGAEW